MLAVAAFGDGRRLRGLGTCRCKGSSSFRAALEIARAARPPCSRRFTAFWPRSTNCPKRREKQLALCQQALRSLSVRCAASYAPWAVTCSSKVGIDLACRSFEAAAASVRSIPQTWHLIEIAEVATVCHATCQDLLGDTAAAARHARSGHCRKPASQRLRRQLLELYIRHDNRNEALELVGQLPPETPHREALRSASSAGHAWPLSRTGFQPLLTCKRRSAPVAAM